jgi:hypothetical protein
MKDSMPEELPPQERAEDQHEVTEATIAVPFPETFIYSNISAFSTSFMDVRIGFAEAMPDKSAKTRVGVVMPPEHAAHVALSLLRQLEFFEARFGPIRLPAWRAFRAAGGGGGAAESTSPEPPRG